MRFPKGTDHPWFDLPRNQRPIWIHCSSGEFEYAKPVIKNLKQKHPNIKVLVTYYTPTFRKSIENFPGVDMSCPLPWDLPGPMNSFIKHHRPQALLIARTDLWPEMLYQAKKNGIPSLLFSAAKGEVSQWDLDIKPFKKWLFSKLNIVFAVTQEDRLNLLDLGADLVHAKGDTRYDQVFARLANPKSINNFLFDDDSQIPKLMCGSTWVEDELEILRASHDLVQRKRLQLALIPHEPTPEHVTHLESLCAELSLPSVRYSQAEAWPEQTVLIVDRVGVLAELYQWADLAFVGGSFKSSVHSVMEPLAAGCPTFVGPYFKNNREAIELKDIKINSYPTLNVVNVVSGHMDFFEKLIKAVEHPSMLANAKKEIKDLLQSKTGASGEVVNWVEGFVDV